MPSSGVRGWVTHWINATGRDRFDAVVEYDRGGKRQRKRRTFKTRKEARAALPDLIVERERLEREAAQQQEAHARRATHTLRARDAPVTVGALLDAWLERSIRGHRSARTYQLYALTVRKHLRPFLGAVPLAEVEPGHVIALHDEWAAREIGERTRVLAHTNLGQAMKWAKRMRWMEHNPVEGIAPPPHRAREMVAWTLDEARRFLAVAGRSAYGPLWFLALTTGLRRGELLGLRWGAVDWVNGVIRVERAMGYAGNGAQTEFKEPKRHKKRAVNVPPSILDSLRAHQMRLDAWRDKAGPHWQEHGLVFPSTVGTPIHPDNLRRTYAALLAEAGVPPIRIHDLRHTFATLALSSEGGDMSEADLKIISESMGHADVSITLRTYAHILPARRKGLAARMDKLLARETDEDGRADTGETVPPEP